MLRQGPGFLELLLGFNIMVQDILIKEKGSHTNQNKNNKTLPCTFYNSA